ncbi:MAG: hypothetical protein HKL87_00930 [Acidimicrobiaceae bacterium]|nr:hypothetical protein [Acidimicrobiaceae bacterium]
MALVDKVKNQAAQLAQKAQDAGKAGQAKIEEMQARRHADGLLRDLGAIFYSQLKFGGEPVTTPEVTRLTSDLREYEAEYGAISETPED